MEVRHVDPRDMQWESEPIGYRVYFWEPLEDGRSPRPGEAAPWASDEYELTEVRDVIEALEWADAKADGRRYTLYAVHQRGAPELGILHLLGVDPTIAPS